MMEFLSLSFEARLKFKISKSDSEIERERTAHYFNVPT